MAFDRFFTHPAFRDNPFRFVSEDNIIGDGHLGIAGDRVTALTPESAACRIAGLQNCPYTASGFSLEVRVDGEKIPGGEWTWLPNAIRRRGSRGAFEAKTVTLVPPGGDGVLMLVSLRNRTDRAITAPVQLIHGGSARRETLWNFNVPNGGEPHFAAARSETSAEGSALILTGAASDVSGDPARASAAEASVTVCCSLPGMTYFKNAEMLETERTFASGESLTFAVFAHLGAPEDAATFARRFASEAQADAAFCWLDDECARIFAHVPRFTSDSPALDRLYLRSLVTYSLNRFENPNYATSPFYSTGSITGGCMCSYLWDYSGGMMLHPLVDPETNRKMILAYLGADLCASYAILPLDGAPTGPWYHINQEKFIGMIYYHVLQTGDVSFLSEKVGGKTVLEWAVFHAYVLDDPGKPVALADYGAAARSHLELRRKYVYQGVVPDLNARRYQNYERAYRLTCMAGCPDANLHERAEGLRPLLETLWDDEEGWYDFLWEGKREKRYTVQMFKFFDSPVIGDERRRRLAKHLNDEEFLSRYGLHSMSKKDPAYDQIDIDNGGGGICVQFTMQVAQQLYRAGYDTLATDIVCRVLWWGERLPYLGDSLAANMRMDRADTPLQSDISSASAAQMILFGMCGIAAGEDGMVRVSPAAHLPARRIRVENVRLRGKTFTLEIADGSFSVTEGGTVHCASLGETITF